MSNRRNTVDTVVGLAYIGALALGVISLIGALVPFFSQDYLAAGVFLIASALAFALLAIAGSR